MDNLYRISLAVHIVAIISWMAGVLYLYRLFVYHAMEKERVVKERFITMETRLFKYITMPAMGVALLAGLGMIFMQPTLLSHGWLHAKLLLVFLLMGITHLAKRFQRQLAEGSCNLTHKQFRILNEIPTVLMILIVLLVILRPF